MKIGFLSNLDDNLYLFRMPIMKALRDRGHKIYAISPKGRYKDEFLKEGFEVVEYKMSRGSINPLKELYSIVDIYRAIKPLGLDILQTSTVKPNIYGTFAAKLAKVPKIYNLVEGMGSFYIEDDFKSKVVRAIIETLYKKSSELSDLTIFVNSDDPQYMIERGLIDKDKVVVIRSVGVDTDEFNPANVNSHRVEYWKKKLSPNGKPIVMMVARAIWHKGIREFYEVAEILKPKASFVLVGDTDNGNPSCANEQFLKSGAVNWIGRQSDMVTITATSDIFVLPSYREEVPKTLLEAASMAKPIVTTDTVGCREVVEDGKNGFLVPLKDTKALMDAINRLIDNPTLREEFGKASRKKAIREFDVRGVVAQYLPLYEDR